MTLPSSSSLATIIIESSNLRDDSTIASYIAANQCADAVQIRCHLTIDGTDTYYPNPIWYEYTPGHFGWEAPASRIFDHTDAGRRCVCVLNGAGQMWSRPSYAFGVAADPNHWIDGIVNGILDYSADAETVGAGITGLINELDTVHSGARPDALYHDDEWTISDIHTNPTLYNAIIADPRVNQIVRARARLQKCTFVQAFIVTLQEIVHATLRAQWEPLIGIGPIYVWFNSVGQNRTKVLTGNGSPFWPPTLESTAGCSAVSYDGSNDEDELKNQCQFRPETKPYMPILYPLNDTVEPGNTTKIQTRVEIARDRGINDILFATGNDATGASYVVSNENALIAAQAPRDNSVIVLQREWDADNERLTLTLSDAADYAGSPGDIVFRDQYGVIWTNAGSPTIGDGEDVQIYSMDSGGTPFLAPARGSLAIKFGTLDPGSIEE